MTSLFVCGRNDTFQLSTVVSDAEVYGLPIIKTPKKLELQSMKLKCISSSCDHTVMIDCHGRAYGLGDDRNNQFGSSKQIVHKNPALVEFDNSFEKIIWASSGHSYTLYLTEDGRVIYNGKDYQKKVLKYLRNIIYIAGSQDCQCAIDENGDIYLFDKDILNGRHQKMHFDNPIFDVARSNFLTIAVDVLGHCYGNSAFYDDKTKNDNKTNQKLLEIPSLKGINIIRVYSKGRVACALSSDGKAYMFGSNEFGELGVDLEQNYISKFTPAKINEKVVSVGLGNNFTVFVTENGSVYGCGKNTMASLMLGDCHSCEKILIPQKSAYVKNDATFVTCGNYHTIVMTKDNSIKHTGIEKLCDDNHEALSKKGNQSKVSALFEFLGFSPED
ncbi:hypothetical protein TRFO_42126 [Tritrichomonas foetus]|uniref:Uncharacterized protein n=1 Tax=Tritrichomonas foetus TaxID=1144522 RepID=A0A1J4KXM2_9EUKA|nr:hypothetical protein TRFO_42126 [Tritrichomonas foetus]|eukprot:OHT16003.1 hypothetical protein TRFO_42126 [Tritrichomonas foetus]